MLILFNNSFYCEMEKLFLQQFNNCKLILKHYT
jgi:hypothetical protein